MTILNWFLYPYYLGIFVAQLISAAFFRHTNQVFCGPRTTTNKAYDKKHTMIHGFLESFVRIPILGPITVILIALSCAGIHKLRYSS